MNIFFIFICNSFVIKNESINIKQGWPMDAAPQHLLVVIHTYLIKVGLQNNNNPWCQIKLLKSIFVVLSQEGFLNL